MENQFPITGANSSQDNVSSRGRVYFPGLNGLRLYAAISIVIAHVTYNFGELRTRRSEYGLLNAFALNAQSAVNLFFVLSGFLITYHLFHERATTGRPRRCGWAKGGT